MAPAIERMPRSSGERIARFVFAGIIQEIIKQHLENVKTKITNQMAANDRNASGRSVASLTVEVSDNVGVLWGSKSFLAMEHGRKGGKIPKGFVGIIRQWIIDKGIVRMVLNVQYSGLKANTTLSGNSKDESLFTSFLITSYCLFLLYFELVVLR